MSHITIEQYLHSFKAEIGPDDWHYLVVTGLVNWKKVSHACSLAITPEVNARPPDPTIGEWIELLDEHGSSVIIIDSTLSSVMEELEKHG